MLIVQKYGGATLSDPKKIKSVAQEIAIQRKSGNQMVIVVSAMGSTTNQLIELAHQVSEKPHRRELDMLLTSGERISMSLLTMALLNEGCDAISFTGSQAGILTDQSHVNANIIDVKADRVRSALQSGKIVVLAGFQGVSPITKEITTLGRGGSDTTAVAMAAYLKADRCEILKDVPSIFTADPKLVEDARPIERLSYQQLLEMTFWGAKVVNYRSVELALRSKVPLFIGPANIKNGKGTMIQENNIFAANSVLAINKISHLRELHLRASDVFSATTQLQKFLSSHELPSVQILSGHPSQKTGLYSLQLTAPEEVLTDLDQHLKKHTDITQAAEPLCAVSLTCTSAASSELIEKILASLSSRSLIQSMVAGPLTITFYVKKPDAQVIISEAHNLIGK